MAPTKEQTRKPSVVAKKRPELAKRGPEKVPPRKNFSAAVSPLSSARAQDAVARLSSSVEIGGAGGRAQLASAVQRSAGNARLGQLMAVSRNAPPSTAKAGSATGKAGPLPVAGASPTAVAAPPAAGSPGPAQRAPGAAAPADAKARPPEASAKSGGKKTAGPSPHAAIAPVVGALHQRASTAGKHTAPGAAVASAQAAGVTPETEQKRSGATETVENLHDAKAEALKRDDFKTKLKEAIEKATPQPKTEAQADQVVKSGAAEASTMVSGQVTTSSAAAAAPLKAAGADAPGQPPPPKTALQPEQTGNPPAAVSAASVAPAPLPPEQLDYSSDRAPTDRAMAESNVTQKQLEKGNESQFGSTLSARSSAEKHEATAPTGYRKSEAAVQDQTRHAAQEQVTHGLATMHEARGLHVGKVAAKQAATAAKNAQERQRITDTITGIRDQTRKDVEAILQEMEDGAGKLFEAGLARAEKAYEDVFEDAKGGVGTWLTTWGSDWEKLIENSLAKARAEYLKQVNSAVDEVATFVDSKLQAAKDKVSEGRQKVQTFVSGLDKSVQQFGEEALQTVSADFDSMGSEIDQRRDSLVDKLAEQYKQSYDRMSAMEQKLRDENKSLWQRVYDATVGVIKQILAFKDMLLGILAKAANVISDIIADPIGFLGNLVAGVMQGLKNFMSKIGTYLLKGLMDWLFGALAGAGLQLPDSFDLKGIVSIVLQVLGLTYANFRSRAVAIVGEPVVSGLEKAAGVIKIVMTQGISGLWEFIKEKVSDLKSMVMDAIFDFIKERVIIAGVTWIIGLLNPASAFFKACKAIYDIVSFIINRGSQIMAFVNSVIDSMAAIAKGSIGVAATLVENALAKAIPVAIGFLAGLLGLGDISGTIKKTIDKAQAPVNKAIDWVINTAVKAGKGLLNLAVSAGKGLLQKVGLGGKEQKQPETGDPQHDAKISAGLAAIDNAEQRYLKDGKIEQAEAEKVAATVKSQHPVFQSITVVDSGEKWNYEYVGSRGTHPGPQKSSADGIWIVDASDIKPPASSRVGALPVEFGPGVKESNKASAFEIGTGDALKTATGQELIDKGQPEFTKPGVSSSRVRSNKLLQEPKVYDPGLATDTKGAKKVHREPDFIATFTDKSGPGQIEVFEVTLDCNFSIGRPRGVTPQMALSHKRTQIAGTVDILAKRFPNVPIIYNIRSKQKPVDIVTHELELELRRARKTHSSLSIEIIWRYG